MASFCSHLWVNTPDRGGREEWTRRTWHHAAVESQDRLDCCRPPKAIPCVILAGKVHACEALLFLRFSRSAARHGRRRRLLSCWRNKADIFTLFDQIEAMRQDRRVHPLQLRIQGGGGDPTAVRAGHDEEAMSPAAALRVGRHGKSNPQRPQANALWEILE